MTLPGVEASQVTPAPLFSIVVPCYNYAHTLERAVASVLDQGCDDFELIIVNDGSPDATDDVVLSLEQQYPNRFRYIKQRNGGPAAARNAGIRASRGDFLLFLDADDALVPEALTQLRQLVNFRPDIKVWVGGHVALWPDGKSKVFIPPPMQDNPEALLKDYLIRKKLKLSNGSTVISRAVFERYRFPEAFRCVEDIPVFAYALANFPCKEAALEVIRVHKHADSGRHNLDSALGVGMSLVDEVFDEKRLPAACMRYRKTFEAQRGLSLFRSCYLSGEKAKAIQFYCNAFRANPGLALRLNYLRKFLRLVLKPGS
jgi:glycosyltransferase involved in cell wall biosynthesis